MSCPFYTLNLNHSCDTRRYSLSTSLVILPTTKMAEWVPNNPNTGLYFFLCSTKDKSDNVFILAIALI